MSQETIEAAMAAVMRASRAVSEWEAQRRLLRAFSALADARRAVLRQAARKESR